MSSRAQRGICFLNQQADPSLRLGTTACPKNNSPRHLRALTISKHGGLEQLEYRDDVAAPERVGPNEVRVRVRAAALNHLDLFVLGGLPGITIAPPFVLGSDCCG